MNVVLNRTVVVDNDHSRTGNFLPGGAVNYLPKKFSQVAQIFTKQWKRNEAKRCNNVVSRTMEMCEQGHYTGQCDWSVFF